MSRIGKIPVNVPEKAKVTINGNTVTVEGPKGKITKDFNPAVRIEMVDHSIIVKPANKSVLADAMYGTARAIIQNMVKGVMEGYSKTLLINGVGFKAVLKGKIVELSLGFSHLIEFHIPEGVVVTVTDNGTTIKIDGADKEAVGQSAAKIKSYYPVEPYKGKGVRLKDQYVRRKEGKKTA